MTARTAAVPSRTTASRTPLRSEPVRPALRLVSTSTGPVRGRAATSARTRSAARSRRAPFVLLVVGLLVGTTLALLVLNTAIAVDSLKANQLRAANAEKAQDIEQLQQQVVSAGAPAELAEAAVDAGLVPAGTAAYLMIGPDGETIVRGTPAPAGESADGTDESGED